MVCGWLGLGRKAWRRWAKGGRYVHADGTKLIRM